ncbi:MAG: UDP-N-acetylmuramate:L-alanyl-gamma-D-glutamyl-meso-diaminopimelate ligase [Deltaproteobacteria bacterium]|nr:UDP-N-acetylmuramate:L-alanyl-gamma-D-glutamyl-meso-diaminopimelate ligase [Deltaproteobacteria bacterium]MBW2532665.1 UDP-N-acetylmuramate:L-alanyl-gamma-D-glutamyl-meso-diaminopimelate ligase [Deltaproteobacteria bacterium]
MHVHFIAVAGTGMGSLAGLLKKAGHDVSGSDEAFYPPMGPALRRWGIRLQEGFDPSHLDPRPDLVVIGNVCRPWHVEARAAVEAGLPVTSMVGALGDFVLPGTRPLVVGGTHGKTTTSAMAAWVLDQVGQRPGFLIGGLPKDFDESFRPPPVPGVPFVIEGDEYDSAFFEKTPKFWHYRPEVAIVTSIEHDHVDIYPDESSYLAAFAGFVARVPADGLIVAHAGDGTVVDVVSRAARAGVAWYALEGEDLHGQSPQWLAAPAPTEDGGARFDVYAGGSLLGRTGLQVPGAHNVQNALAVMAAACQGYGVPHPEAAAALQRFAGVSRRQDLVGTARQIRVYDDFAHHPTAVRETLKALRQRHRTGTLWAVYEPRSATACRRYHQQQYPAAFAEADRVVLAPVGRPEIPEAERLDYAELAEALAARQVPTDRPADREEILTILTAAARPGDTIALLSNGSFGGLHQRLLAALAAVDGPR